MSEIRELFTPERIEEIAERLNYPKLRVEQQLWLHDTASKLKPINLVLKGGTAIQQHIKHQYRRISLDLDYNLHEEMSISEVREKISTFGFEGGDYNKYTGTLTYYRVLPTLYKTETLFNGKKINAHLIKAQINIREVSRDTEMITFNLMPDILDGYSFNLETLPLERLLANKIIVSARSEKIRVGRTRYRDLFDVVSMTNFPRRSINLPLAYDWIKRELRMRGSDLHPRDVINSCSVNLHILEDRNALGFYPTYGVPKEMAENIDNTIKKATTVLDTLSPSNLK